MPEKTEDKRVEEAIAIVRDISERKLAENKLRESEDRLKLVLEATSDGVWERHIPSGNMLLSPRYYATLGYTPLEFEATYRSFETYVHPEDLARVRSALAEHFTQQKEYKVEFRLRHKSGEWFWILSRGRVVEWDAQGRPIRMVGTCSDISARKLSEQKLQESERRLRTLYDGAPLGIGVVDSSTGRLVQVNPAYCRITGWSSDELRRMDLRSRTHPDDIAPQLEYMRRLREGEVAKFQMDKRYVRPDGSIVWASVTVVPLWEFGTSPTFHLSMVEEITARKQAEESLRERNYYIDTILENAPIGFAVITVPDGRMVFAGSKFEEIHGLPQGSVTTVGEFFDAFQIDLDSRAEIQGQVAADIASGHPSPAHWENIPITTAAGAHKFVTISQIPIPMQNLLVCTVQDVTERKRAEEALSSNEAKMQSIVSSAMDAIISVNEQQRIVVFNHAAEKIFQCAASEALGSSLDRFIPAEQCEAHRQHIRQFGVNGRTQCFAPAARGLMAVRANGEEFPIEITVSCVQAGGQKLYTAILRDITERKQAEETLRTSEEGLRLLGDNLPNSLVFQYTREGDGTLRFLYISAGVERLYGVKAVEVLKDAGVLQRQLLPEGLSTVLEAEQVAARDCSVFEREVQVQLPDGRLRWMHILSRPRRLPDGRIVWDGVETDITERRLAEQKLRRSEEQMRALAARVQSVAEEERLRISRELHDQLGQSLTAIKMELDWLARKHGAGEEVMVEQVRDAMQLVDSTIGLVRRLSTELRPATLDTFGLSAALEFQVEEFQRRTGIQCSVELPQGRLNLSPEQRIAIFRICQEALTNIVRHAGASRVHLTLEEAGGHTVFTIRDDGKGFPIESLDNKGALGILGMRERAIMLGGALEIQSVPGKGTEITLRIPLPRDTVEAERT